MSKLIHNKKSNLGLIFEYIMQELVESIILKDFKKKTEIIKIVKKYFFRDKYLKEEFSIFTAMLNGEYSDRDEARRYLVECLHSVEELKLTLNERKKAKQELLEELYKVVDKNKFFEHDIKNYSIYSTINLILDYYSKNKKINEINNLLSLERKLLEHIQNNKVKKFNKDFSEKMILEANKDKTILNENEQVIAIVQYRNKLFNKLNENQKQLLEFYISTSDEDLIENKLNQHFRVNNNELRKKYMTETIEFTKEKYKEAQQLFEEKYKNATLLDDKLKIILDSFVVLN